MLTRFRAKKRIKDMENNLKMKENILKNGKYVKDSFDRFGDDLTELLLSFLPLKQKIRFECVSKQWKSLIFNKHFVLDIIEFEDDMKFMKQTKERLNSWGFYYLDEKVFEFVLKKCVFIKHIKIMPEGYYRDNGNVFVLMANNCRYLEKLEYCFGEYGYHFVDIYFYDKLYEFGDKCGLKLKLLNFKCERISNNSMKQLLKKTPNVRKVAINDISIIIDSNDDKFLSNLIEVKFYDMTYSDHYFKVFTDKYHNKMESIIIDGYNWVDINNLIHLSRFEKLKVFTANLDNETNITSHVYIDERLKLIANKCSQLKDLNIGFDVKNIRGEVFKCFSHFKSLNSLSIQSNFEMDNENVHSFGQLKDLSSIINLSKLSLDTLSLSDEYFKDIHLYLPNLSSICLTFLFEITDKTLEYISKLPNLSSVKLDYIKFTSDGIQKFIDNSLNLRLIHIESDCIPFEDKVFNCLIEWAKRSPKYMHKYKSREDWNAWRKWDKIKKSIDLPKNLIIDID